MESYRNKSKADLIKELKLAGRQAAKVTELRNHLKNTEKHYNDLKKRFEEREKTLSRECFERNQTQEALQMAQVIIDNSPVILFRRLAGGETPRLQYVSDNIKQYGYTAEEFLSGQVHFKDIVHPDDFDRVRQEIEQYAQKDVEEYVQTYRILTNKGNVRWVEDQTSVVRDNSGRKTHNQGIVVDITRRKLAEEQLRKSEEKFRRIVETAGEGFLMMNQDLKIVDVNDAYCKMLGYERDEILGKTPLDLATDDFRQFLVANREKLLAMEYRKFEGTVIAKGGRKVPVLIHGNILRDAKGVQMGNVAFVTDLTEQKKALALAGVVQRGLIPSIAPKIEGFDIAGRSHSCEEVGGDYFDFLQGSEYSPDSLKVVVGDISGHGVDAALLMTSARAFIRTRAAQAGSPSQIISSLNRDLAMDMKDTGHFMTLFYLEIDARKNTAHWVRAGHDPALIYYPSEDKFDSLGGSGLPLGVDEEFNYADYVLKMLAPGMVIALGTDGIWESSDAKGHIFGKERLQAIIRKNAGERSEKIVNQVFDELARFTKGMPHHDDVTLVIIKVDPFEEVGEAS
jgi:sigma-B regulation protein RsbU (phosphoserine phosphatase)